MKQLICINCPRGCRVEISGNPGDYHITGNFCPRGKTYAVSELEDPRRTVTAAVPAGKAGVPCASVRTAAPLPVKMIPGLLNKLYAMRLTEPARRGDVLIADYENSGVDVIFTADFM